MLDSYKERKLALLQRQVEFLETLTPPRPFGKEIWKKSDLGGGKHKWFKGTCKSFSAVYDDGEQTVEAGDEISWEKPSEAN